MSSPTFFSGWIGLGYTYTAGVIAEPTDSGYSRRVVTYGPLFNGRTDELGPGTIGPAASNWNSLVFAGLFDAASGGDLLAFWPLSRPITLAVGQTWTTSGMFGLVLSVGSSTGAGQSVFWTAGSQIGTTTTGRPVIACQNLAVTDGHLSMVSAAATPVSLGSLPTISPATGSGQLWNNGGVICVA